jgi:hypothetical protein
MARVAPYPMTNREAILRLSVNSTDGSAITSLYDNNAEIIRAVITRYLGIGQRADNAERVLMQRMADRARSYERQQNADEWIMKCATTECDRLRNEAIYDKANRE